MAPLDKIQQATRSGHVPGASGRVLSSVLQAYLEKLDPAILWSTGFPTLKDRFKGLQGSQLTDLALWVYATSETKYYKLATLEEDGRITVNQARHPCNCRSNPKGELRYEALFSEGGYAAFVSGKPVGQADPDDPRVTNFVSGATRTNL